MLLYNSLTRQKEKFTPLQPPNVGMYTCGPTVYDFATIGNFRTYTTADFLLRYLKVAGYKVKYVMNLTDVGHLTGDNLGNADIGEDKVEKAARKEKKTAWDIADFYTRAFFRDYKKMNLIQPNVWAKATDHIQEQIAMIQTLIEKGFAYKITDGIYFDVKAFEKKTGKKYGRLSTLDQIKEGARIGKNPEKRDSRDFALWKFSPKPGLRHMEWESPWGVGFPGWHIECSAMSIKYLGEQFDIHIGGEDLRQTHHPNELAQAEAATGKQFVRFWVHVAFLLVEGRKMSKSLGNAYTLSDIEKRNFDPLALKYLYLTAHYRDPLNFTWEALKSAQQALYKLRNHAQELSEQSLPRMQQKHCKEAVEYRNKFLSALADDLNTPQSLSVFWEVVKSNLPPAEKKDLLLFFDEVFGLKIFSKIEIPQTVKNLARKRESLRKEGKFSEADKLRAKIESLGYTIDDTPSGPRIRKMSGG